MLLLWDQHHLLVRGRSACNTDLYYVGKQNHDNESLKLFIMCQMYYF